MTSMKNKQSNYFREFAGLRIVAMYVQEFFHWGWQPLKQQNDDGIDGYVIVRDRAGRDLGCNIRVQIKSGPGYLSSRPDNKKSVRIKPYASEESLKKHLEDYDNSTQPVIMVWVNTRKEKDGKEYEDYLHPEAWWERVDHYDYQGGTVITLTHKFGEHSKGDWFKTVKDRLNDWKNHPLIKIDPTDNLLLHSINLKKDAKWFYQEWGERATNLEIRDLGILAVKKTRIGWRHINYLRRGRERIKNSLELLSIAEKIINHEDSHIIRLGEKEMLHGGKWVKYGLRARVQVDQNTIKKVQVVLLIDDRRVGKTKECHFFSVHVIK